MSIDDKLDIFQRMRRSRIRLFEVELKKRGKVHREQFLAEMDVLYGIRPKTGKEYLRTLENVQKIRTDNKVIVWLVS